MMINKSQLIKELAQDLAVHAKTIRYEIIPKTITNPTGYDLNRIYTQYKEYFRPTSTDGFADFTAQVIVTGLLISACLNEGKIDIDQSISIPGHQPVIASILNDIPKLLHHEEWTIVLNAIATRLNQTETITNLFSPTPHESETERPTDPFNLYCETFLSHYDPLKKEKYGIYFTPLPAVEFIVRSTQRILNETLEKPNGIGDEHIRIIEPALGTAAFLAEALRVTTQTGTPKHAEGETEAENLTIQNLYGFEIVVTPFLLSILRLTLLLNLKPTEFPSGPSLNVHLTDTLTLNLFGIDTPPALPRLASTDIPVIIGNPPYNGYTHFTNGADDEMHLSPKGGRAKPKTMVETLVENYLSIDGRRIDEKVTKGLKAAYVQFIRLAQFIIDQTDQGIIAFITNHSYLDNPTFRGMRKSLMSSVDEIYILDLNGHVMKNFGTNGNIFDIRQGTAISFFIKKKKKNHDLPDHCKVFYREITGTREEKLHFLAANEIGSMEWNEIHPTWKYYDFKASHSEKPHPGIANPINRYRDSFIPITDIFPMRGVGIVTARDELCYEETAEEIFRKAVKFSVMSEEQAREAFNLKTDARDWSVKKAQEDVIRSGVDRIRIIPILYRPFDIRYTYYTGKSRGFLCMPRPEMTGQMLMENIALITVRQVAEGDFSHAFVSDVMADARLTAGVRGICYLFPLYVYQRIDPPNRNTLIDSRTPNINPGFYQVLEQTFPAPKTPNPQELFHYIYAVLFSNRFRNQYRNQLVTDFPAVPITGDYHLFIRFSELGQRLKDIHLLKSGELDHINWELKIKPENPDQPVIDPGPYLKGITDQEWAYVLNGYRIMDKWEIYKTTRKGERMSALQLIRFLRTAAAIRLTIRLQEEIDDLYPEIEKNLVTDISPR